MAKLYLKWAVLVWANAIIGLIFADIGANWAYNVGIVLGVCVFIPLYALIDNYAIKNNDLALQKSLLIGVILRAGLQCVVIVDLCAGIIAQSIAQSLLGSGAKYNDIDGWHSLGFWDGFLTTVLMGGVLSVLVGVLVFFIMLVMGFCSK